MLDPIFVIYRDTGGLMTQSYGDYWNMVRMWNFPTCEFKDIDYADSSKCYIWTTHIGNPTQVFMTEEARARKCKLVFWNLEWCNWKDGKLIGFEGSDFLGIEAHVDEMWVSDRYLMSLLHRFKPESAHKVKFICLGGHPDFGLNPKDYDSREFHWDFAHLMYLTGVRGQKFHSIMQAGNSMAPASFDMEQRHHVLSHSRWGLNLHQNSFPCLSPQRFMIFASYGLPIVTDYCADPYPFSVFQDGLVHWNPRKSSVMNKEIRDEAIQRNYRLVTGSMSFRAEVERMAGNA